MAEERDKSPTSGVTSAAASERDESPERDESLDDGGTSAAASERDELPDGGETSMWRGGGAVALAVLMRCCFIYRY